MKYLKYLIFIIIIIPFNCYAYTIAPIDITSTSIDDLSKALDRGYLTSEILVTLYLERIGEYNKDFNAINTINENAIDEARVLDLEREKGIIRGPLHGIPIFVKTNIDVKSLPTTAGSKSLKDNYPNNDAFVISKLKEEGAIILGSTNMSEFAFLARDSYSSYGHVKNAFNTNYTPYGSSGGSAVAVALSFAAASLGTDTNSSVRLPASAAGLVGLRPTIGLISRSGVIPYDVERDTIGIITKTINDNALILSVIAGTDANDEKTKDAIVKDYNETSFDISSIKIGVINNYVNGSSSRTGVNGKTDTDIANLTNEKIELMKENGIEFLYIEELLNNNYLKIANNTLTGGSFCDSFNDYIKNTTSSIRSFQELAKSSGHVYGLNGYLSECNDNWNRSLQQKNTSKTKFENHILEVMHENDIDIIIYPTMKIKNLKLDEEKGLYSPGSFLGSVIGYPSITVPMGYINGFAYGLEFFSTKYNEDLLYNVARFFEELNDLPLTNSPLTPNLYEVPEYITNLINIYNEHYTDKKYQGLIKKSKEYFKSYYTNNVETNETIGLELLESFNNLNIKLYNNNFLQTVLITISIVSIICLLIKYSKKLKK